MSESATMPRRRPWRIVASVGLVLAVPAGLFGLRFGYEHAQYSVVTDYGAFEVRRYAPRIVAEVTIDEPDAKRAASRGFSVLADYIFGNNVDEASISMTTPVDRRSETIAMTTPVDTSSQGDGWTVAFTMPASYALHELPRPLDPRVRLREVPEARYAAVRFSGRADDARFMRRREQLRDDMRRAGLAARDERRVVYAQYDPPWTPGFLRRNEVMFELSH
jgi:hypothetical protein